MKISLCAMTVSMSAVLKSRVSAMAAASPMSLGRGRDVHPQRPPHFSNPCLRTKSFERCLPPLRVKSSSGKRGKTFGDGEVSSAVP